MFDRIVVVDWSANSRPKLGRDSIWIAVHDSDLRVRNLATRTAAERALTELFADGVPTLLGVDFSLGYPVGTAAALGLDGVPWSAMWQLLGDRICDDAGNRNNRFSVAADLNRRMTGRAAPFWGRPSAQPLATLSATKPKAFGPVGEWREVESVLRSDGRRPFSSWQLLGAGAVGSQSLLGIATLGHIVATLGKRASVWPFTTGLKSPIVAGGSVVVAEVWPSLVALPDTGDGIRDERQVEATARWLASLDATGELASFFAPDVTSSIRSIVTAEEGWVLGVTPPPRPPERDERDPSMWGRGSSARAEPRGR